MTDPLLDKVINNLRPPHYANSAGEIQSLALISIAKTLLKIEETLEAILKKS